MSLTRYHKPRQCPYQFPAVTFDCCIKPALILGIELHFFFFALTTPELTSLLRHGYNSRRSSLQASSSLSSPLNRNHRATAKLNPSFIHRQHLALTVAAKLLHQCRILLPRGSSPRLSRGHPPQDSLFQAVSAPPPCSQIQAVSGSSLAELHRCGHPQIVKLVSSNGDFSHIYTTGPQRFSSFHVGPKTSERAMIYFQINPNLSSVRFSPRVIARWSLGFGFRSNRPQTP